MRLMRYDYSISHVPGKSLIIPDTLLRAPVQDYRPEDLELENETKSFVQQIVQSIPATEKRLKEIQVSQQEDEVCKQVTVLLQTGGPQNRSSEKR